MGELKIELLKDLNSIYPFESALPLFLGKYEWGQSLICLHMNDSRTANEVLIWADLVKC